MAKRIKARHLLAAAIVPVLGLSINTSARADLRYWDRTDGTAGAGATPTGTWDAATSNWNLNSDGSGANSPWVTTDTAVFSAGTDAINAYTVTVSGTQTAAGLNVEEGTVTLATGVVSLGTGAVVVSSGATLSTDSSLRISTTAGSTVTLNGGTLRTTNAGANGTFFDTDSEIVLGTGGGTLSYSVTNTLNIVQTATKISGSGSLTKAGAGILAFANTNTYTGSTTVADGELRIRGTNNILPTGTAMTVNGAGILNLNGLNQQVASLSGNGTVGTGNGTLTVSGSANTTFSGVIKNFANGGAGAVTTGNGKLVKSGTGVLTLSGLNDITGSVTLSAGGITVASGGSLANPVADLNVNGGTLTLNNAAQTIENFNGTGGSVVLGTGHTLTSDSVANATYAGTISGAGGLTKANGTNAAGFSLTLTGNNTYTGPTTINGGSIVANATTGQALGGTTSLTINSPGGISSAFSLGKNDQLKNSATVTLNGGTFNTAGFSEGSFDASGNGVAGAGALTLAANSIIDLGSGASILAFADSSAATWTGTTLNVYNYSGTADAGGGTDRLYFGANASGLTAAQLADIKFFSDAGTTPIGTGAAILPTGEVVPTTAATPEPTSLAALGLGALALVGRRRRRA